MAVDPNVADGHLSVATSCLAGARAEIAKRGDPAPWFEKALSAGLRALERDDSAGPRDAVAEVWIARGRWELESGRSPEKAAASALEALAPLSRAQRSIRLRRAEALLLQAAGRSRAGQRATLLLDEARADLDIATPIDPRSARCSRLRAELERQVGGAVRRP